MAEPSGAAFRKGHIDEVQGTDSGNRVAVPRVTAVAGGTGRGTRHGAQRPGACPTRFAHRVGRSGACRTRESPRPQAARFALFVHDSGLPVVLLVVQCAALQYRFLVPLLGARQCDWIRECVREASVLLSVDAPQTKQFALVNVLLNLRDDGPLLLRHCESAAQPTRDELVSVMATLVGALQPPHRVTSLVSGIAVARARVFVTLPVAGDVPPHGAGVLAPGSLH